MPAVVVDTDVASYLHKRDSRARRFHRHLVGNEWIASFMSVAELYEWSEGRRWGERQRARLQWHMARFAVHWPDRPLCRLWAEVRAQTRDRGRPIDTADAWIAASALALGVPLVTNNPDDYAAVEGLTILTAAGA